MPDWNQTKIVTRVLNFQKHTIVGGTGDFEDVRRMLRIQGVLDVTTLTINYSMTGEMCL